MLERIDEPQVYGPVEWITTPEPSQESRIETTGKEAALDAAATVGVVASAPVVFEAEWAATMLVANEATGNPLLAALLTTAATVGIEVGGSFGASRLLAKEGVQRGVGWVRHALGKIGVREGLHTSVVTDAAVAFPFGTAVMTTMKQIGDPERTKRENQTYGLKMALLVSALGFPVNLAVAEGVADITPAKAGFAALAVGGLFAAKGYVKRFAQKRIATTLREKGIRDGIESVPTYDLDPEELNLLERDLVKMARKQNGRTISAVWIEDGLPHANLIRTKEAEAFPGVNVKDLFDHYEPSSMFLALIDTRRSAGKGRMIRGTRITGRHFNEVTSTHVEDISRDGGTDMAMIRDMVADGEMTSQEFLDYYAKEGINLADCISVETNFKIGERAKRRFGVVPMSQLAYLAMYKYVIKGDRHTKSAAIFAHINQPTRYSLAHLGVSVEPVIGREDLRTPAGPTSQDRYDDKFAPVTLLNTEETQRAMRWKLFFAPKEIYLAKP